MEGCSWVKLTIYEIIKTQTSLNTNLQKCFEFMSLYPFPRKPVKMVSICYRSIVNAKTTIFILNKGSEIIID